MKSAYIHIPFCKTICSYCDFCKMYKNKQFIKKYLKALQNEIKINYQNEVLETLYIGGGTPSCLDIEDLKELFKILKGFKLTKEYEFTFECNIDDINANLLRELKGNRVNRLSIGIQSFNPEKLKFLNRKHSYEDVIKKIKLCRLNGFDNINLDLIYATKIDTMEILKDDLKKMLSLNPEHISTYSLILEKNTMLEFIDTKPVDEEYDYEMYKLICQTLKENNYVHYEVSNFSKEGYQSKHNLTYWNNENYYGFGLGAHGYIGNVRTENTRSLNKYLNGKYLLHKTKLTRFETMENEIMLGLRKIQGIDLNNFYQKYQERLEDAINIAKSTRNGDLIIKKGYISINEDKIYIMNEVLLDIL